MSNVDIIARLKMNAQGFSSELNKSLGDVERKFGTTGSVIGRNISEGIGGGLQDVSSRIPFVSGALTGLSGSALVAAAGIGALAAVLVKGIEEANGYEEAVRGLDAVLRATGNTTGYTRDQLVGFADDLEGAIATPSEEIQGAEKVLASFGGVAGDVFKRVIKDAADLAAVYGGDLASNTEKLGTVMQNLAQGEVTGLSKGFKFLGVEALTTIENLAKVGKTAEAQQELLKQLEKRVGGTAENKAGGLTGAFFRLGDAIGDTARIVAEKSGAYATTTTAVDRLAASVNKLAEGYQNAKTAGDFFAATLEYLTPGEPKAKKLPKGAPDMETTMAALNASPGFTSLETTISKKAAEEAYASAEKLRKAEKAKEDAAVASKKAEQERDTAAKKAQEEMAADLEKLTEKYGRTSGAARDYEKALTNIVRLETTINPKTQKPYLSASEGGLMSARIASLQPAADFEEMKKSILYTTGGVNPADSFHAQAEEIGKLKDARMKAEEEVAQKLRTDGIEAVRAIGESMQTIFGVKLGSAIDKIADRLTGGKQATIEQQQLTLGITKLAKGIGLNDQAAAAIGDKVGKAITGADTGAMVNQIDKELGISKALGLKSSKTGAEIGGAIGKLSGIPGLDIVGSVVGSVIGGLFKKTPTGSAVITSATDPATVGGKLGGALTADATGVQTALRQIADVLHADLGSFAVAIGQRGDRFTVSASGNAGNTTAKHLSYPDIIYAGADQSIAVRTAISNALADGAILGISDAAKRILSSGKDLDAAIQKAADIEAIPRSIKAIQDPFGAAIDGLNEKFKKLIATLNEAQATPAQLADAEKLYGLEREQIVKQYGQAANATLKSFLSDLKGSDVYGLGAQETQAKAALDPYLADIAAGKSIDQQAYTDAAQKYLDIERQLNGSTDKYFAAMDMIQSATNNAIATIDSVTPIRDDTTPFVKATADATAATASSSAATADILSDVSGTLVDVKALLAQIAANGGGGAMFGDARNYVQAV